MKKIDPWKKQVYRSQTKVSMNSAFRSPHNWPLLHTFVVACDKKNIKPHITNNFFDLRFKNGNYILLWTPLNKMKMFYDEEPKTIRHTGAGRSWSQEQVVDLLEDIENNQGDFHCEPNGDDNSKTRLAITMQAEMWVRNHKLNEEPTVEKWLDFFEYMSNMDAMGRDMVITKLKQDPEDDKSIAQALTTR